MKPRWTLNFFGYFLMHDPSKLDKRIVNHELIHTAQMRELLWIPFYLIYGIEWIIRFLLCFNPEKAYKNLSFEKEAYRFDHDFDYLTGRKPFSQWRRMEKLNH